MCAQQCLMDWQTHGKQPRCGLYSSVLCLHSQGQKVMANGQQAKGKASMQWACNKQQREKLTAIDQRPEVGWAGRSVRRRQQTAGLTAEMCLCSSDDWRHVVRCFLEELVIQQLGTGWPLGRVSLNACLQRCRKPGLCMNTAQLQEWWAKLLAMADMHSWSCILA